MSSSSISGTPMPSPNEELKEVTKLVLYGWGYPSLFSQPNGDRFQNRLVGFPPNAAPTIAGADQVALKNVLSRLKIIKQRHRDLLKRAPSDLNPVWVWVDTPKQLSYPEKLAYREQFENWIENTKANDSWNDRLLNSDLWMRFNSQAPIKGWRRKTIAAVILAILTLAMVGTV